MHSLIQRPHTAIGVCGHKSSSRNSTFSCQTSFSNSRSPLPPRPQTGCPALDRVISKTYNMGSYSSRPATTFSLSRQATQTDNVCHAISAAKEHQAAWTYNRRTKAESIQLPSHINLSEQPAPEDASLYFRYIPRPAKHSDVDTLVEEWIKEVENRPLYYNSKRRQADYKFLDYKLYMRERELGYHDPKLQPKHLTQKSLAALRKTAQVITCALPDSQDPEAVEADSTTLSVDSRALLVDKKAHNAGSFGPSFRDTESPRSTVDSDGPDSSVNGNGPSFLTETQADEPQNLEVLSVKDRDKAADDARQKGKPKCKTRHTEKNKDKPPSRSPVLSEAALTTKNYQNPKHINQRRHPDTSLFFSPGGNRSSKDSPLHMVSSVGLAAGPYNVPFPSIRPYHRENRFRCTYISFQPKEARPRLSATRTASELNSLFLGYSSQPEPDEGGRNMRPVTAVPLTIIDFFG